MEHKYIEETNGVLRYVREFVETSELSEGDKRPVTTGLLSIIATNLAHIADELCEIKTQLQTAKGVIREGI